MWRPAKLILRCSRRGQPLYALLRIAVKLAALAADLLIRRNGLGRFACVAIGLAYAVLGLGKFPYREALESEHFLKLSYRRLSCTDDFYLLKISAKTEQYLCPIAVL